VTFIQAIKTANLALRFLLELCALVAFGYWGSQTGQGQLSRFGLGLGTPLLYAVVWGTFVAPRAPVHLSKPVKAVLGLVILEIAAAALAIAGQPTLAAIFGAIVLINAILLAIWKQ
jgi:thiol:disulfide interchange protein